MWDFTTDEGIEAFNNRSLIGSDGTPYNEATDAKFIKSLGKFVLPTEFENIMVGESIDEFATNVFNSAKESVKKLIQKEV